MKLQYDLPQEMLNKMLGDWQLIYPKYSMALWENMAVSGTTMLFPAVIKTSRPLRGGI